MARFWIYLKVKPIDELRDWVWGVRERKESRVKQNSGPEQQEGWSCQELRGELGKNVFEEKKQVLTFGSVEFELSIGHPRGDVS